ncbi:MAG: tRNA (adenosine(37)-N6)-dimethylallyltransferase MiaA [Candidatus Goldbacteria bacterium]|nr:tRNA (adenosine(37)-N6)-dimethylallyltransferase MiaA [Candidatus Goldiibacteriota bacterium]
MFIIIGGPTGTGKSTVAVELALLLNGEIISADSMQIYKEMNIGTNKNTITQRKGIEHHLIDVVMPDEPWTVARYKKLAEQKMDEIKNRGKIPIIVGGTGLYIESIIRGLFDSKEPTKELKKELRDILHEKGLSYLIEMLYELDPEAVSEIDTKNSRRVLRAIEIIKSNNMKLSEIKKRTKETIYKDKYYFFVLTMKRKELYEQINKRVDDMIKAGLEDEVRELLNKGYNKDLNSMQAIGYKEMVEYIEGKISKKDAIERIKKNTRNYAKRQETWFKRYKEAMWIDTTGLKPEVIAEKINLFLNKV